MIRLAPGDYSDVGIIIDDSVTIKGESNENGATQRTALTYWSGATELWNIQAGGYLRIENIYVRGSGSDSLARCNDRSWEARNCTFDFAKFVHTGDTTGVGQQGHNQTHFYDCTFLCRSYQGGVNSSDTSVWVGTTWGWVLMDYVPGYYGPYVANGAMHVRERNNYYGDSTTVTVANTGVFAAYEPVIIAVMGAKDCPAVHITGSGAFTCYGGEIVNNDSDKVTVLVETHGSVHIEKTTIKNKYVAVTNASCGGVYKSTSDVASTMAGNIYGGAFLDWNANDILDWKYISWDERDIVLNDNAFLLTNRSGATIILQQMEWMATVATCSLAVKEYDGLGVAVNPMMEMLSSSITGTAGFYSGVRKYADIDDHHLANGNRLWLRYEDVTTNPLAGGAFFLWYIESIKTTPE
jgi:hypothetical protein